MSTKGTLTVSLSVLAVFLLLFSLFLLDEIYFQPDEMAINSEKTLDHYISDTSKLYEIYTQFAIRYNHYVFDWHLRSTKILFWTSIIITLSGIGFAFCQFIGAGNIEINSAESNEMEIKSKAISLAFKSRSLAALIIFISIAYFVVYVIVVYPIEYKVPNAAENYQPNGKVEYDAKITPTETKSEVQKNK